MNTSLALLKQIIPKKYHKRLSLIKWKFKVRKFTALEAVCISINNINFLIIIDPKNGYIDECIFLNKEWESHIARKIINELSINSVFVDVGANIGYFSLIAAKIVGPSGKVFSFEPLKRLVKQFSESADLNEFKCITIFTKAVGEQVGEAVIGTSVQNIGGSSLVSYDSQQNNERVIVTTLDSELSHLDKIDLIKIDVEGFEYSVLLGAAKIIQKFKPKILLEFSPSFYKNNEGSEILKLLENFDYKIFDLQSGAAIHDVDIFLSEIKDRQTDLFCEVIK